jgi:hypothetical protein
MLLWQPLRAMVYVRKVGKSVLPRISCFYYSRDHQNHEASQDSVLVHSMEFASQQDTWRSLSCLTDSTEQSAPINFIMSNRVRSVLCIAIFLLKKVVECKEWSKIQLEWGGVIYTNARKKGSGTPFQLGSLWGRTSGTAFSRSFTIILLVLCGRSNLTWLWCIYYHLCTAYFEDVWLLYQ